jgi:WD40 repeat protein
MKNIFPVFFALTVLAIFCGDAVCAAGPEWSPARQVKVPGTATVLAYSRDGSRLAVGHADGQVTIWDPSTGTLVKQWAAHSKQINSLQFYDHDTKLLTLGNDNRARLWSTGNWSETATIEGTFYSGAISPDNRWLAAQSADQSVWLWDLATLKPVTQLTEKRWGRSEAMSFSADGKRVMVAVEKGLLIDIEQKVDHSFGAILGDDPSLRLVVTEDGKLALALGKPGDDDATVHRVATSRSGPLVALGRGWFVDLWDGFKRRGRIKPKEDGSEVSFSYDDSLLAISGTENTTIWKVSNRKRLASVKGSGVVQFSPTSLELAVTDRASLIIYAPAQPRR